MIPRAVRPFQPYITCVDIAIAFVLAVAALVALDSVARTARRKPPEPEEVSTAKIIVDLDRRD